MRFDIEFFNRYSRSDQICLNFYSKSLFTKNYKACIPYI